MPSQLVYTCARDLVVPHSINGGIPFAPHAMLRKILWAGVGTCALLFGANKWGYDYLVMPCLLKVDPERAHRMVVRACRLGLVPQTFQEDPEELVCN